MIPPFPAARRSARRPLRLLPALLTGGLVTVVLAAGHALASSELGPLSRHMGVHLLLMNVLAPLLALVWGVARRAGPLTSGRALTAATAAQMAALWTVHLPAVMAALDRLPGAHTALQLVLFGTALWFWMAVVAQRGAVRWRALIALLVTGKLACLLGVLLVFAPREIYPGLAPLVDQQRAGLWMIAACPLTYVGGALVVAVLWLGELGLRPIGLARRDRFVRPA